MKKKEEQKDIDREASRLMMIDDLQDLKRKTVQIKETLTNIENELDSLKRRLDTIIKNLEE